MVYVERVESNVKKGCAHTLARLTLLVGPNGSGKTSVQNAVELALCGFASDVEGRDLVRKGDMLAKLGPGGKTPLSARVVLSDKRQASWTLTPNTRGGYKEPAHVAVPGLRVLFPVQDVRAVLAGSADTIRLWLMGKIGGTLQASDVEDRLPPDLLADYRAQRQAVTQAGMTEVDILLAVITKAESEARALLTEGKGAQATIDTMGESLAERPTQDQLQEANRALHAAEERLQSMRGAPVGIPDLSALREQAKRAIEAFSKAEETARLAHAATPPLHPREEALIDIRSKIADICEVTTTANSRDCLVCASPLPTSLAPRAVSLRKDISRGQAALNARALAAQKTAEAAQLRTLAETLVSSYKQAESQASVASAAQEALNQAFDEVLEQRDRLGALKRAEQNWHALRAAQDQLRAGKKRAALLKELAEACEGVVEQLLVSVQRMFERRVQAHLPSTDRFALVLLEGKKPVCRLGFVRRDAEGVDKLHTALSGAEWARLTLALGAATYTQDPDTLAIFTPEERAFDPQTLRHVMSALSSAPGQVILQSPNPPAEGYPADWAIIRL